MASTSPHPRCVPNVGDGEGGVGHRKMTGPSRNGSAKPFATLLGSSTITVMRDDGALPTTECTASATDSICRATRLVHSSISAGKWMSNRAVEMVRHGMWGRVRYCACAGLRVHTIASAVKKTDVGRGMWEEAKRRRGFIREDTKSFKEVRRESPCSLSHIPHPTSAKIGRASCRERVQSWGVAMY